VLLTTTWAACGTSYRFFVGFLADFFTAFLRPALVAIAALADFFPNAVSQLSEYFFDAPIRTIVTAGQSSLKQMCYASLRLTLVI
jgi:hypothetical protein